MSLPVVVAVTYLGFMLVTAALADEGLPLFAAWGLILLTLVHVCLGAFTGRWWVLALPVAAIALFLLFGAPNEPERAEVDLWLALAFRLPLLLAATLLGFILSRLVQRARTRSSSSELIGAGQGSGARSG